MSKSIAEQSNALSIFWLKKHGYFDKDYSRMSGGITWTYGYSKSSIGFAVVRENWGTEYERTYLELNYTHTDSWGGEKISMSPKFELVTTPCNYGGKRYWFICPLTKGGVYCGRRVGVIYSISKYFGCRHCGDIAYDAQMKGGKYRGSSLNISDIEKAEESVKREYYNGRPTKKYRRLIRMNARFNNDFILMASKIDGSYRKLINRQK